MQDPNTGTDLEKLLSSIRHLVTGLKNDIQIQKTKISNLEANYQVKKKLKIEYTFRMVTSRFLESRLKAIDI